MDWATVYGGWIAIDVRALITLALLSVGIGLLLVGLFLRRRPWHQYLLTFLSLFVLVFLIGFVLLQTVFSFPVVVARDFFPLR
ncbi:MAG TPA: hypothetical protein PLQ97_05535 [Myxococcota bacterium]|nr:hypothetical protein [Myxococcota bacterium]HQK50124.1 hypothetical protein [Myxococcota bacterium]